MTKSDLLIYLKGELLKVESQIKEFTLKKKKILDFIEDCEQSQESYKFLNLFNLIFNKDRRKLKNSQKNNKFYLTKLTILSIQDSIMMIYKKVG